ncbi:MAG: hypothetical protein M3238_03310 [Actinomycetota bacterium]|nr:hypothetical protein [Actinomycetota bacterium]
MELILEGDDPAENLIRRGIRDVKRIGLWDPLTRHLGVVKFAAYEERYRVPPDNHLADASPMLTDENGDFQLRCDIVFYSLAMAREVTRLRRLHDAGVIDFVPPDLREAYASVVAHELAHCLRGPHGEKVAQRWERRALTRLRARR